MNKKNVKGFISKNRYILMGALAAGASLAGAQSTADSPIDFSQHATKGVAIIGSAGGVAAALLLARNGLKIAVKWAKSLVGMS